MKKEILEEMKERYQATKDKINEYVSVDKRIKELEENELIKEYFMLLDKRQERIVSVNRLIGKSDEEIMAYSYRLSEYKIQETNNIFVYMGTYRYTDEIDIEHPAPDIIVDRDDSRANYSLYRNIENSEDIIVPIKEREIFETENNILFTKLGYYSARNDFARYQHQFMIDCIKENQDVAIRRLLKK